MGASDSPEIRTMVECACAGDRAAADKLFALISENLRQVAAAALARRGGGHTLQPTALVHEAYIRLMSGEHDWTCKTHFFRAASRAVRHALVDYEQSRRADKRGGGWGRVSLESVGDDRSGSYSFDVDLVALDEALDRLACVNERAGIGVEMRFFGGCSATEIAEALGVSTKTIERDWSFARAWLSVELDGLRHDERAGRAAGDV